MNERELDLLADRLEGELSAHRLPARVTGATVTPRLISYHVATAPGVRLGAIQAVADDLARTLRVSSVRVAQRDGLVLLELPRDDAQPVGLLRLLTHLGDWPPVTACLGATSDGAPLLLRLTSPDVAHVLIAGTTGSGKTVLLRSVVLSLALRHATGGLGLVLIDPRGGAALGCFDGLPQLRAPVICETAAAGDALGWLVDEMQRRDIVGEHTPPLALVIDELADLLAQDRGGDIQRALSRLVARGRGSNVHVIAATQRPSADAVSSIVRANFPVRIVGRVTSSDDARVAAGQRATGAERLAGRGDFVLVSGGGVMRFGAAMVTLEEISEAKRAAGWTATPPALEVGHTCEPEPDDPAQLAERLRPWWSEHGNEWGSKTKAVKVLFGDTARPEGHDWQQTIAAIRIVETSSHAGAHA
jgi:DNA segregation ATPase FtsK/SpoIIIE, S-DNA-T family